MGVGEKGDTCRYEGSILMYTFAAFFPLNIQVIPRQTCQLYTHTYSNDTFKGGREEMVNSALGGTVFNTLLYNPVSVQLNIIIAQLCTGNICTVQYNCVLLHVLCTVIIIP